MNRFHGTVGFLTTVETEGSVWREDIIEKPYYGDIRRFAARFETPGKVNDDIKMNHEISIVADTYAYQNCHLMRYVKMDGDNTCWEITSFTVERPRIILSIGGVYNADNKGA